MVAEVIAEAVVDVVGKGGAGLVAGAALLAMTAAVGEVEIVELAALEELVAEAFAGVADAAQAHTALAEASTARPVTASHPLRTLERAAVLTAAIKINEDKGRCCSRMGSKQNLMVHIDMRSL